MRLDPVVDPAVDTWLCVLAVNDRRPATLTSYEYATRLLAAFHSGSLLTVGKTKAVAFVGDLRQRHRPGGVASIVRSLRAFYGWCLAEELVVVNPFARLAVSLPKTIRDTPTDEQIDSVLCHAVRNRRDFALLAVPTDTGCQCREPAHLSARGVERGAAARDCHGALALFLQRGRRDVLQVVTDEVLEHLAGDERDVELEHKAADELEFIAGEKRAGRIVPHVQQLQLRLCAERWPQLGGQIRRPGRSFSDTTDSEPAAQQAADHSPRRGGTQCMQ